MPKSKRTGQFLRWSLVLVAAVAVGAWYNHATPDPVRIVSVERGSIESVIRITGAVINDRTVKLTALSDGQLQGVTVGKGDEVDPGQELAFMDNREAAAKLRKARSVVQRNRLEVRERKRRFERLREIAGSGGVSAEATENAEIAWQAARAALDIARAELEIVEVGHDKLRVLAPFAGVVTEKHAERGQWLEAGTELFTLVAHEGWEIEANVDAADSGAISLEQRVALSCDAFPGHEWEATIHWISPSVSGDESNELNTFSVRMDLGEQAPPLLLGQQVDVRIRTAFRENTVKVPFVALDESDEQTRVALVQKGRIVYRTVVTGIEDFTHVEIREGLNAGDRVALLEGKAVAEGEVVEAVNRDGS